MQTSIDAKIESDDILRWAEKRINLSSEDAKAYREQGDNLRDRLATYINEHPEFDLVKMLNSGSVAKGTALRTKSDMDVAVYVKRAAAPAGTTDLVAWLHDRLTDAYQNLVSPEQITSDEAAVRIAFRGSGVDVECVAILVDYEASDDGELVLRTGERVQTNIHAHLDFIRDRKKKHPTTFAQFARLLRHWRNKRAEEGRLAISPFAIELLAAHVVDGGVDPSDIPGALQAFFSFIVRGGLNDRIIFTDNYEKRDAIDDGAPVRIIDPVASANNVTKALTSDEKADIVDAAADALDDVTIARTAITKDDAITAWRGVFGPEFNI
jgi:hypothetical protein